MDVLTNARMKKIDEETIARFCPGLELMERAGRKVTEYILARFPEKGFKAAIFVGPGNNGGDALVVARRLSEAERACTVLYLAAPESFTMDTLKNYQRLQHKAKELQASQGDEPHAVRLDEPHRQRARRRVSSSSTASSERGSRERSRIARSGRSNDQRERRPRREHRHPFGCERRHGRSARRRGAGRRARSPWGIPSSDFSFIRGKRTSVISSSPIWVFPRRCSRYTRWGSISTTAPRRRGGSPRVAEDAHKYQCGTALVIAREPDVHGRGAARGRGGASERVRDGVLRGPREHSRSRRARAQRSDHDRRPRDERRHHRARRVAQSSNRMWKRRTSSCVGPGMSRHPDTTRFVLELARTSPKPLVIDADGLNALEGNPKALSGRKVPIVITPHSGELSKLVVAGDPARRPSRGSRRRGRSPARSALLSSTKGRPTLIASAGGEVWVNYNGTSALATAGTGDVLTGLIGGLAAQGRKPASTRRAWDATSTGGRGRSRRGSRGVRGVIAGDLLKYLGEPLLELEAAAPRK